MPDPVKVRLCFHDRCFDGAASAAVFYRFFRERINPGAQFQFTGMAHQARQQFADGLFDGDENAIVDFKYSSSPRVTWWFDHHQSAFLTPADAEHFRQDRSGHKFYDPDYKSCTKLLADVTSTKFGFDTKPLAELIHWGDIIDGAQYPTPESAVAVDQPATQLALVIESAPENGLVPKIIPDLSERPLAEMVKLPVIARHLGPLLKRHHQSIDIIRERTEVRGGVIFFDISDLDIEGYNKFIPYMLYPDARYTVSVLKSPTRSKISIGSNPWNPDAAEDNLASLAEQYGGGGHPRVAAISLDPGDLERAKQVARDIAGKLRR
ncbi:MAG: phosphoesterase [Acidobacteriia bacterium]|nr:phosphoesterase [Terriglobia bacterium]